VACDIVAVTWATASRAARSTRNAIVAAVVMVYTPLRSGMVGAARAASGLVTSGWAAFAGATWSAWRLVHSTVSATWAAVTLAASAARVWVRSVLRTARTVMVRIVFPVARAVLLPVGAVVLVAAKALSKARSLATTIRLALKASGRRAAQQVRQTASAVGAALSQSIRRASASIRRTASSLRAAVAQSVRRASASTRRTRDSVRLAVRTAKESVLAAVHAARESLRRIRRKGPTDTREAPKHPRRH
jgi:hypothetical protein